MLIIENCNSLSDLRQKLIDGEEVRTARQEPCEDCISRREALKIMDWGWKKGIYPSNKIAALPPVTPLEQEPCEDLIIEWKKDFKRYVNSLSMPRDDYKGIMEYIDELPVNPQQKIGRWVYRIYGQFHEEGNWHCSKCDYIFNGGYGHAKYCPECGCKMSEPPTEEMVGDKDYDWITRR